MRRLLLIALSLGLLAELAIKVHARDAFRPLVEESCA